MTTNDSNDDLLRQLGDHARDEQRREALRPLSQDFQQRMAQQIKSTVDKNTADAPARSSHQRTWFALAASLMLGIGLSFGLIDRSPSTALPDYELEFRAGAETRSSTSDAALRSGDALDIVLRPRVDTAEPLVVYVVRRAGDTLVPVDVTSRWSDSGAVRISATLDAQMGLAPGPQDWWFVVARARDEYDVAALSSLNATTRDKHWLAFRHQFEFQP